MEKILLTLLLFPSLLIAQITGSATVTIDTPAPICNIGDSVFLDANYIEGKATDSYTVSSIPFTNLFSYTSLNLIPNNPSGYNDDYWTSPISLPFEFSFYGNCYTSLMIGTNGVITFDFTNQTSFGVCPFLYELSIPNTNFPVLNAIYGVFQDLNYSNSSPTQSINYYTAGTAPNRVFVINYYEMPHYFNQSNNFQSSQIVLYETTNIIDVNVKKRTPNDAWNIGRGVIGVQNQEGTSASFPLGRNTGNWSATNESWRFTPNGALTSQFVWKKNGIVISNQNPITVNYTQPNDVYQASVIYNGCTTAISESSVTLNLVSGANYNDPINISECLAVPELLIADLTINEPIILNGITNPTDFGFSYHTTLVDAMLGSNPILFPQAYAPQSNPETIYVAILDYNTGCYQIKTFTVASNYVSMPTGNSNQNFTQGQTLQNLVINGTNVQWYANQLIGITLPLTIPLVDGTTYYATQTINGCESPERLSVTTHLTLANDTFLFQNLKIQPNPVTDIFIVSNQNNLDLVEVYNTIGQTIISKKVNDNQVKLDLSNYNSGVYFVKVYSENQNKTIKIIKN